MYIAGYIVTGFVVAGAYAFGRLRGRWGRYERTALAIPLTIAALAAPVQVLVGDWAARDVAEDQPIKLAAIEGLSETTQRRARCTSSAGTPTARSSTGSRSRKLLSLLAFHDPNATRAGARRGARPTSGRRSTSCASRSRRWSGSARCWRCSASSTLVVRVRRRAAARVALVLPRASSLAGPLSRGRADRRLGDDRGRPPAVGRLPRDAHRAGGHRRRRHPGRLRDARRSSTSASRAGVVWVLRRLARAPLGCPEPSPTGADALTDALRRSRWSSCWSGWRSTSVLGGADFGAGLWQLSAGRGERGERIRDHAHDSMAPVWEANHVWLIFVLTVSWTAYPTAFGSIASTLVGAAVHRRRSGSSCAAPPTRCAPARRAPRELRRDRHVFAVSSMLTPFALGAAVGGIASGRVPVGNAAGDLSSSWLNPTSILIGVLAVGDCAYLAAVYLAADAARRGERRARARRSARARSARASSPARSRSPGWSSLHADAHRALPRPRCAATALPALIVSALAGARDARARLRAALRARALHARRVAVAAIVAGWALAQWPTLLPGPDGRAGRGAARHAGGGRRRRARRRVDPLPVARRCCSGSTLGGRLGPRPDEPRAAPGRAPRPRARGRARACSAAVAARAAWSPASGC